MSRGKTRIALDVLAERTGFSKNYVFHMSAGNSHIQEAKGD
jgi:hypothetical protein